MTLRLYVFSIVLLFLFNLQQQHFNNSNNNNVQFKRRRLFITSSSSSSLIVKVTIGGWILDVVAVMHGDGAFVSHFIKVHAHRRLCWKQTVFSHVSACAHQ